VTDYVIDASVAIKWVVSEPGTQEALALRQHRLIAPDLLIAECANILWKKVRRQELLTSEGIWAVQLLARADIDLESARPLMERATRLAIDLAHPAYDCVYIALAEARNCAFVTADESLCRKSLTAALAARVIALSKGIA
jgi:predicted nucleic acid-binding protein